MGSHLTDLGLRGRVAYVTGSTRGIGWAVARHLAGHGMTVVIGGRDTDSAQQRAAQLRSDYDVPASAIVGDQADSSSVVAAFKQIKSEHGALSVLVNNAGIMEGGLLGMLSAEQIDRTLAINTRAVILNMQSAVRLMRRAEGASIINLTSILGVMGNVGQTVYSASKAAVIGATKSAAKELGPSGIRVNAVAPGFIDTDLTQALDDAERSRTVESIRLGRAGSVDDVANVITFLASDMAAYITGQVIGVDGGMLV